MLWSYREAAAPVIGLVGFMSTFACLLPDRGQLIAQCPLCRPRSARFRFNAGSHLRENFFDGVDHQSLHPLDNSLLFAGRAFDKGAVVARQQNPHVRTQVFPVHLRQRPLKNDRSTALDRVISEGVLLATMELINESLKPRNRRGVASMDSMLDGQFAPLSGFRKGIEKTLKMPCRGLNATFQSAGQAQNTHPV